MSPGVFLLSLAGLAAGTYLMRLLGVKLGGLARTAGLPPGAITSQSASAQPSASASGEDARQTPTTTSAAVDTPAPGEAGELSPVRRWLDRSAVVLIAAVAITTAVFDGKDWADPARLMGVGLGVVALICRVPMLAAVLIAMAVTALARYLGW